MIVLGIETSCDETAAAVVDDERHILGEALLSQTEEHRPYGGVVPEIAARSHLDHIDALVAQAMDQAGIGYDGLDGVAVTGGPGLIGGVIVGVMCAKAIALAAGKPFLAVNHLEGHALSARLVEEVDFPYLLLLVSGGHCQILVVEEVGNYHRLGGTMDDAAGEAFDKTAKVLGLGYPGGPAVEAAAREGNPERFDLPRPLIRRKGCDFSFSGLKTAVRRMADGFGENGAADPQDVADLCAGFQAAVGDVLVDRCRNAIKPFRDRNNGGGSLVLAGGVAANGYLRGRLETLAGEQGLRLFCPPPGLCTDNGAMIAWAGVERLKRGMTDDLDFAPRPRWPLDQ